ncbi:MAG: carbon-nitrogen hydrolase family protein [Gammaproteobacteria bacterium]
MTIRMAVIQMTSGVDVSVNLAQAEVLFAEASREGATLALFPENFALMARTDADRLKQAESFGEGPIQDFLARAASRYRVALIAGTIPIRAGGGRVRAASLVYDADGSRIGRYDKMHLFDVDLGPDERYRESLGIEPGEDPQVVDVAGLGIGLSVCYDLRFPELYRLLVDRGATVLTVPSAFTVPTGADHWDPLLRARAIENQCYVLAAAQSGHHENGRRTYGRSRIIDPWGVIVAERLPSGPGVLVADYDASRLQSVRDHLPALRHRRPARN